MPMGRLLSQDCQSILHLQEDLHSDPCPCVVCVVWSCTEPRRASNPRLPPVSVTDKQASTACAMDDGPRKTSNLATNRNVRETTINPLYVTRQSKQHIWSTYKHRADYWYDTTVPNFGTLKNDMDDGYGCILVSLYSSEPCLEPIGRRLN